MIGIIGQIGKFKLTCIWTKEDQIKGKFLINEKKTKLNVIF